MLPVYACLFLTGFWLSTIIIDLCIFKDTKIEENINKFHKKISTSCCEYSSETWILTKGNTLWRWDSIDHGSL